MHHLEAISSFLFMSSSALVHFTMQGMVLLSQYNILCQGHERFPHARKILSQDACLAFTELARLPGIKMYLDKHYNSLYNCELQLQPDHSVFLQHSNPSNRTLSCEYEANRQDVCFHIVYNYSCLDILYLFCTWHCTYKRRASVYPSGM